MLFQSLGFYVMPFAVQVFFTAKTANTIRRTQVAMPLYMLMYPFLVIASYYAISQNLHLASPNEAFFAAAIRLLPGWLLGLVAAGASLSGLLVLTGICLAIGPIVTRNLLPNMPESRQKAEREDGDRGLPAGVDRDDAADAESDAHADQYRVLRRDAVFPGRDGHSVLASSQASRCPAGILTGQILAIILYMLQVDLGGFNLGLLCLVSISRYDGGEPREKRSRCMRCLK